VSEAELEAPTVTILLKLCKFGFGGFVSHGAKVISTRVAEALVAAKTLFVHFSLRWEKFTHNALVVITIPVQLNIGKLNLQLGYAGLQFWHRGPILHHGVEFVLDLSQLLRSGGQLTQGVGNGPSGV
jgi:hypothetical protein